MKAFHVDIAIAGEGVPPQRVGVSVHVCGRRVRWVERRIAEHLARHVTVGSGPQWTAANLPDELVKMLDVAADRRHSEEGPVRSTLAALLNRYDELRGSLQVTDRSGVDGGRRNPFPPQHW